MNKDPKTTLFGILAAAALIGAEFAPPQYKLAATTLSGLLLAAMGYNSSDKK